MRFVLLAPHHHHVGQIPALAEEILGARVDPVKGVEAVGIRPAQERRVEPHDAMPECLPAVFGGQPEQLALGIDHYAVPFI